ncbi:MAG: bile acid:sodium symporter family protein, partial [Verrucomicrobiota bacterium]
RVLGILTNAFPIWILLCSVLALFQPQLFTWFDRPFIIYGLGVIMLGMGMTLTFADFIQVLKMPRAAVIGVICQFTIMPLLGWAVAYGFGLHKIDPNLAVGLILVACCPGGTASNVVAFLAKANVALSVLMTIVSTFAAIFLTPLMTKMLAGALVEVDAVGLFRSTVQVVLVPVLLGLLLNRFFPKVVSKATSVSPLISVIAIVMIVSSIVGASRDTILNPEFGWKLLVAPAVLHIAAFFLGYFMALAFRLPEDARRTISIEVGMQNSGLGAALAKKHFANTTTPVPCAISAVYHCLLGSIAAGFWRWRSSRMEDES